MKRTHATGIGKPAKGFSLMELLMVMSVIALLAMIMVPSIAKAYYLGLINKAKSSLFVLEGGIRMYAADFNNEIPPSQPPVGGSFNGWPGSAVLTFLLTGYANDNSYVGGVQQGTPDLSNMGQSDGVDGAGFRLERRGKIYGPYGGAEAVAMMTQASAAQKVFYCEQFYIPPSPATNPPYTSTHPSYIFYCVFRNGQYAQADNQALTDYPNQTFLNACDDHRSDFILVNPGPTGTFSTAPTSDDVTNF